MRSTRIALVAAVAAVTSWSVKAFAIEMAGGLDKSSLEAPMFFGGLASFVVAVVSLGVALTRGSRTWIRVLGGIGGLAAGIVLTSIVDGAVNTFSEPGPERHWVWTEVNLWVVALTVLALTCALAARRERTVTPG
jgi:hypothetical protein